MWYDMKSMTPPPCKNVNKPNLSDEGITGNSACESWTQDPCNVNINRM